MEKFLTYEQYGAVGDGKTNDMPAIVRTHEEANREGLPVRAKEGAVYYIAPVAACAEIRTDTDWTGATFLIDDRDLEDIGVPIFSVPSDEPVFDLPVTKLDYGQDQIENPTGKELLVFVRNDHHRDYIRRGVNRDNGGPRRDIFLVRKDGTLTSPVATEFEEITLIKARTLEETTLTLKGGTFVTLANRAESKYHYHARNLRIQRSNVKVTGFRREVREELDHGAPYGGFLSIGSCARVEVEDCVFTGHKLYWTIGNSGDPSPMGSYDISCGSAVEVTFRNCSQTNDIMDRTYWGIIGTNGCRDLKLENCVFSRFDAHTGVTNCTIRGCRLGHQSVEAIGHGSFRIEDTEIYGHAFIALRPDYGCSWRGSMEIRNCIWHAAGAGRSIFYAENDGTHDFGYDCYLPQTVLIDGFTLDPGDPNGRLTVFQDWTGKPESEVRYPMIPPVSVKVRKVKGCASVALGGNEEAMKQTSWEID